MSERQLEDRQEDRENQTLEINRGLLATSQASATAANRSALIAVIAVLLMVYQAWQSQKNFETTRKEAADSAAQARQDALDTLHKQLEAQRELIRQVQRSANAAEASSKTSAETLRVSERAYVATTTTVLQQPAPGQQPRFNLSWTNVGHTTALQVWAYAHLIEVVPVPNGLGQLNPMTVPVPRSLRQAHEMARSDWSKSRVGTMTVDAGQTVHSDVLWRSYTAEGINSLKAGKIRLYLFVRVTYDDIFGRPHEAESCSWLNTDFTGFAACEEDFNKSR
jgi:hypothetical protein